MQIQVNEMRQNQGLLEKFLVIMVTVMTGGLALLFGFVIVNPREEIVVLRFGKFVTTLRKQGICWIHPVGRNLHRIPTRDMTHEIAATTVLERNGNPIHISAIVVYRVEDSYKAALEVEDYRKFIEDQASAVIKRCSSQFPYESSDETEACLKRESDDVTQSFISELQEAVNAAGIRVLNVRLNDLTYAPEIAQAMLMRQQAMALIDARKTIVEGAVEIVKDAVVRLGDAELHMSDSQREQLISNLLVVICSGERAQPVLQVQSGGHGRNRQGA
ncbi:MAG: SPFH domain-containing protein [Planctomycetota bacterium]|nr:SPFH domain-containing protein [Planctomycetota bacterium]